MLLQRNINAFSISLTDRGLRMDGYGVGNRTKPSSVSVNDFYQELRNYRIHFFYQELRNYRILLSECGPSDGFFFFFLILDKRKRMCDKYFIETWEEREGHASWFRCRRGNTILFLRRWCQLRQTVCAHLWLRGRWGWYSGIDGLVGGVCRCLCHGVCALVSYPRV